MRNRCDIHQLNIIKDSDSKSRNLLPPHGLLFPISSKLSFISISQTGENIPWPLLYQLWSTVICTSHREDNTYHSLCYTSCGALLYAPPTEKIIPTTAFATPVVEHWLERETAQEASLGVGRYCRLLTLGPYSKCKH